jgi:hypothetical protein
MAVSQLPRFRLSWLKGRAQREMNDTAQVVRTTTAANAEGGQTETTATVATVACRLAAQSSSSAIGAERSEGGRVVAVTLWTCYLPVGTDVRPADVLMVNGVRYEVTDSDGSKTDAAVIAVSLRRIG